MPFWRSLQPESFLGWYKEYATLLQKFFGQLEVAATVLTIAAAAMNWKAAGRALLIVSALLAVAVLAVFPVYFQRVNASFAAGTIPADSITEELRGWSSWHWFRTITATAAFISAVGALRSGAVTPAAPRPEIDH